MSRVDKSEDKNFYQELDKETLKKSCCNCQTMAIFFIVLAIIVGFVTYYLVRQIRTINVTVRKINPSSLSKNNLLQKLNIDKNSPTFTITITSEELTSLVSGGISATGFSISDVQVLINPENIEIFGKLTKPFSADIKITALAEVQDGKLRFKVTNTSAGKLTLPGLINSQIESAFNNLIDQNFANLYQNYQIEQVSLESDRMNISGKIKNN